MLSFVIWIVRTLKYHLIGMLHTTQLFISSQEGVTLIKEYESIFVLTVSKIYACMSLHNSSYVLNSLCSSMFSNIYITSRVLHIQGSYIVLHNWFKYVKEKQKVIIHLNTVLTFNICSIISHRYIKDIHY